MEEENQNEKTLIGVILTSVLCFILVGCGNSNVNSSQSVQKDSEAEVTESAVEETEETALAEITIGDPVVIGDFTFYTEAWHRATSQENADGEGYQATLYFDRSSEPFNINNYDWENDPIKFDLKPAEDFRLIMNSISGADVDSGHHSGLSREWVCVPCVINRDGRFYAQAAKPCRRNCTI